MAVIVLAEDARESTRAEHIIDWARDNMAKHKYLRLVAFIESYPLGPSGKVLKRELVARYADFSI